MVNCSNQVGTCRYLLFFFFNDTATTEIYTLSLHDALPISEFGNPDLSDLAKAFGVRGFRVDHPSGRSEEHTSELQSRLHLVCRLLLEKKKNTSQILINFTNLQLESTTLTFASDVQLSSHVR